MIYIDLILNLSLLVSLSIVSGFIEKHSKNIVSRFIKKYLNKDCSKPSETTLSDTTLSKTTLSETTLSKTILSETTLSEKKLSEKYWDIYIILPLILQGILFGGAAVLGMLRPFNFGPGLIFDGRSVMVSLCALFFGPLAGVIAGVMTIICRIWLGGVGTLTGVLAILSSLTVGMVARIYLKPELKSPSTWNLYLFGFSVHLAMIGVVFFTLLPKGNAMAVVMKITLPVMLLYPLATILAGKILSDMAEAERRMNTLQKNQGLLTSLLNSITDIVFFKDIKSVYLGCNKAFAQHLGRSVESIVGKTDYDFYTKEEAEAFRANDLKMFKLMAPRRNEEWISYPDGRKIMIDTLKTPYLDSNGKLIGIIGVSRDITERKQIESIQKFLAQTSNTTINHTTINHTTTSNTTTTNTTNQTFFETLAKYLANSLNMDFVCIDRLEGDGLTARTLAVWCDGKFEDNITYALKDTPCGDVVGKTVCCFPASVCQFFPRDQVLFNLHAESYVGVTLFSHTGNPIGLIAVIGRTQLTTERQIVESVLKMVAVRAAAELERIDSETEKEKLQAQLFQSQKMESVGRLAGGVAHDFNNMLGVILGHTELALDMITSNLDIIIPTDLDTHSTSDLDRHSTSDLGRHSTNDLDTHSPDNLDMIHLHLKQQILVNQQLLGSLNEIRKAAQRSANLTRQLLAFARKQTIAPIEIDLNQIVESMLNMLMRLIGEDIDLVWMPGTKIWSVKMDPSQIDQILANLCVNSRDAIKDIGKITIETMNFTFDKAYCDDHHGFVIGEYVMLAISDNGCGIDKKIITNIFEPFFTTKETGKGTGIGLATVYGIVKQNNGFINVYSEPNEGTTFRIYIPRYKGEKAIQQINSECQAESYECGKETILLVEDEPAILKLTKTMLQKQGYNIIAAASPKEAILVAQEYQENIHLLMTDVVMPEMNGRDLATKMLSLYPHLKRLFMSGYTANVIAHHGVLDEGVHFIQKPFSKQELVAKVKQALND